MKNNTLTTIVAKVLPAITKGNMTYNAAKNIFLSQGYTSAAGNTYFQALRCSEQLAVLFDVGEGYAHTFLNGIKLFCWDGQKPRLIAQKQWGGSDYRIFNEVFAEQQSVLMLADFLKGQAKMLGSGVSESQLLDYSRSMVQGMNQKRIA